MLLGCNTCTPRQHPSTDIAEHLTIDVRLFLVRLFARRVASVP